MQALMYQGLGREDYRRPAQADLLDDQRRDHQGHQDDDLRHRSAHPQRRFGYLQARECPGVGVVDVAGPGVAFIKPGDSVLISCISAYGRCNACREGMTSHCANCEWRVAIGDWRLAIWRLDPGQELGGYAG